jgi:YD repeat-containing protein
MKKFRDSRGVFYLRRIIKTADSKSKKRKIKDMKSQMNSLKTSVSHFGLKLFIAAIESNLTNRLIALTLITALLIPTLLLTPINSVSAKSNNSPVQSTPVAAPPEPYIFSSGGNSLNLLPVFEGIASTATNAYSKAAAFIIGPATPEGLGAATPPPTFSERIGTLFTPHLFSTVGKTSETKESKSNESTSIAPLLPSCTPVTAFDFDGDCKADIGRWQSSSYQYKVYNSSNSTYTTLNLGSSGSKIAPADFDGDGKFDLAVFSAGAWTIRKSTTNTDWNHTWGTTGDLPAAADYDGDGIADLGIYRPSTNTFWILTSGSGFNSYTSTSLGTTGDVVVPGDFDGDGKADCAVFRPSTGYWYYQPSSGGSIVNYSWGVSTDIPAPGKFDTDNKTDIAVFRPSTGTWYILKSGGGSPNYIQTTWGNLGDQPVPADYDGDGTTDMAVYRPTTGTWWTLKSSGGSPNYTVLSLGTSSDQAVPSAYLKQSGAELYPDQLAPARLAPINATGGTNYYSRNFGWSTGLVSLPGRSGMNLNIGMSYNSLVWTKVGSTMAFDMDRSNIAPGFNFGFPRIEPAYINSQTSILSYLMVSPSGSRTEFRQTAVSDTYETADSSYAQVKVNNPVISTNSITYPTPIEDITLTVTGTDGTQMLYSWIGNAYRCTKIMDRNGNYISISNNTDGQLTSVTDTLGRVVTINYDSYARPSSITQNWQTTNGSGSNTTHTWASFTYTTQTINTSFGTNNDPRTVFGPANSTNISVLDKVTFAGGSYTKFEYNGYAQVYKISNYAQNDGLLNYTWRDINAPDTGQPDCPRFNQTKTKVANFNLDQYGAAQETVVNNSITTNYSYSLPDNISGTATKIEVSMENDPHSSISKTYVGSSGWNEGLPIASEDWATENNTSSRKRWTWTDWTQGDTTKSYIVNPRVIETRVGDTSNKKKTQIDYYLQTGTNVSPYGLVKEIRVYDSDLSTVLKKSVTEYETDTAYMSRRLVGLPSEVETYGLETTGLNLMSKVTYEYDEGNFSDTALSQNISPVQHDTNFSSSFVTGRGNLTSTTRWNVEYPTNSSYAVTSSVKYNTAGSAVAQISPWSSTATRQVKISYTDNWNDSVSRSATYAYPTALTDPANYSSTVKYRYDVGANVRAESPAPAGQSAGKTTTREFDEIGRLLKESIVNTGAYTRYVYSDNGVLSQAYSTLVNVDGDNDIAEDEVLSESWSDGAGRVRYSRTEHPGSTGGYSGALTEYDILGRVKRTSLATEINSNWNVIGDDYARGWLWTQNEYDWKGRITRIINPDSNGFDGKDQLFSYEGCGCAGGQVTTIQSESVPRDDVANTNARRTQKIYTDTLGRTDKTVVMKWDGTTPYTTTEQFFNGRDQITETRQYDNIATGNPYQSVFMTYDGHGRMASRHYPVEDPNTSTSWVYNQDDSIQIITDPRGAATDFTYNSRGLVTQINYTPPSNSTIPDTPTVTFGYDAVGNRISMDTAGVSDITYTYDELSRMNSETVNFDDLTANLTIEYGYHLSGALKSVKDPFNAQINYTNDKTGRITAVGGTAYGPNSTVSYANNIKYRAFGGLKQMDYTLSSKTPQIKLEYDNRLRVNHSEVTNTSSTDFLMKADFNYAADSRVLGKDDILDNKWDRTMKYDFAGRLNFNQFGMGLGSDGVTMKRVYEQNIAYDPFSQMTDRGGAHWGNPIGFDGASYINGRLQANSVETMNFDASGNIIYRAANSNNPHNYQQTTYDTSGRRTVFLDSIKGPFGSYLNYIQEASEEYVFDGDGRPVISKSGRRGYSITNTNPPAMTITNKYQVWSTVLGSSLTTVKSDETKEETKVFAGGAVIARQGANGIGWVTADPVTGTTGNLSDTGGFTEEIEPLGQKIEKVDLTSVDPPDVPAYEIRLRSSDDPQWQCMIPKSFYGGFSGMPSHCQTAALISAGGKLPWSDEYSPHKLPGRDPYRETPHNPSPPSPENTYSFRVMNAALKSSTKKNPEGGCDNDGDGIQDTPCNVYGSIDMSDTGWVSPGQIDEDEYSLRKSRQMSNAKDCEKFLAQLFSGTSDAIFSDVTDGDPIDPVTNTNEDYLVSGFSYLKTHNHLYNPLNDIKRVTNVYAPAGGVVLGGLDFLNKDTEAQSVVSVFYKQLGGQSNIVLQFFHVENFNPQVQSDGRILLGTMGVNGNFLYGGFAGKTGYHIHINAWKWWKAGEPSTSKNPGAPPFPFRKDKNIFKLSNLCP